MSSYKKLHSCPAAFLWGCSSGKLRQQGIHDPSGAVLYYLCGGAPFVVGNLWDVTDVDIDKFSMHCMDLLLKSPQNVAKEDHKSIRVDSVSGAMIKARNICKLKRAVGFAPIMYGVPSTLFS